MAKAPKNSQEQDKVVSFNKFTEIPVFGLKLSGIFITNHVHSKAKLRVGLAYYLALLCMILIVLGEFIYFVNNIANGTADFIRNLDCLWTCSFFIQSIFKVTALVRNASRFEGLIDVLNDLYPKVFNEQSDFEVNQFYNKTKRTIISFVSFSLMASTISMCLGVIYLDRICQNGAQWFDFLLPMWYPFNPYQYGVYELVYLLQYWGGGASILYVLLIDCLLFGILQQIFMQFNHLTKKILQVRSLDKSSEDQLIREFVEKHMAIDQ